jgi:hypothetical protein
MKGLASGPSAEIRPSSDVLVKTVVCKQHTAQNDPTSYFHQEGTGLLIGAARFDAADRHSAGRRAIHRNGDQPCTTPPVGSGVASHLLNAPPKVGPLAMISLPNPTTNLGPLCTKPDGSGRCTP